MAEPKMLPVAAHSFSKDFLKCKIFEIISSYPRHLVIMQKESELSYLAVRTQDPQGQMITVWQLSDRSGLADSEWNLAQVQEIIKHFAENAKFSF